MTTKMWWFVGGGIVLLLALVTAAVLLVASLAQAQDEDETVVRITGHPGVHYAGAIFDQTDGRKDISGTLGDAPEEYPVPGADQVAASVNRSPDPKGMLRVGLYVNGDVVDEASDDSSTAPLAVYYAGNEN
jgi:hypothetical protein